MPPKKAKQEASKVSKSYDSGTKKAAQPKKRSAPSSSHVSGNTSIDTVATSQHTNAVPDPPSAEAATAHVPRPESWETIDWADDRQWQMGLTRQEHFDWLPRRLERFLNGPETHSRDFWHWHNLTNFLRSKVPVAKVLNDDDESKPSTRAKLPKKGKKQDHANSLWTFDDDWKVHRVLGAGSFGTVALWVKKDTENRIVDEMAIKDAGGEKDSSWSARSTRLAKEAVLHHHMNKSEVENFVQLRRYKECLDLPLGKESEGDLSQSDNKATMPRWRFYLEFSPYGELSRLMDRYRAWHQYLPEAFLWHVFDSLALVLLTKAELATDPEGLPRPNNYTANDRMLHFDIKPDNIFLGYQQPFNATTKEKHGGLTQFEGKKRTIYPIIKLGDFGVAELVGGEEDVENPNTLWGVGTPFYKAPEIGHYGVTWRVPPNATKRYRTFENHDGTMRDIPSIIEDDPHPGLHFGQELDVWNVGKVMYELITLGRPWSYAKLSTRRFKKYRKWDYNAIPDFQTKPFSQVNSSRPDESSGEFHPYSMELMDLVKECMKPRKHERIGPTKLRMQTLTQLQRFVDDAEAKAQEEGVAHDHDAQDVEDRLLDEWKVYFKENEINALDFGPEEFTYCEGNVMFDGRKLDEATDDVDNLLGATMDPDWDELRLPKRFDERAKKWRRQQGTKRANRYWKDLCRVANDQITFEPLPSDASQQYRPLKISSPRTKSTYIQSRGSSTEDNITASTSTTSDSEGELIRKLDRKRKRGAHATEITHNDPQSQAIPATTEAGVQHSARLGGAAATVEVEETRAASPRPTTAHNVRDNTTQSAPTVAAKKTTKGKRAAGPKPTRDQPPRKAKKQKTDNE